MAEIIAAERWLYASLKNDATLQMLGITGVYSFPIPPNAVLPYVLVSMQAAGDLMTMNGQRVWTNGLWVVRAVWETWDWGGNLESAANRIDQVLHKASGTPAGGSVWACVREEPFRMPENNGGQSIYHLGGIYRLFVS